ncbi:hypothetical protein PAXRUDRAFT_443842 [Paxillus rubicundulus Ve08.2h10]|uniref:Uncharacterized protein n=1 Tax=Paxillus rubicundulus Ve08.2h10 TaxID=930991 RepID=A0A0D0DF02_9AGAM|nr:hypothetical protein PAXRUDRAFT_443842 [Paxillus rubicundulus Ve08.2h10]
MLARTKCRPHAPRKFIETRVPPKFQWPRNAQPDGSGGTTSQNIRDTQTNKTPQWSVVRRK